MNVLEIKKRKLPDPDDKRKARYIADIFIDGRHLDDFLTQFELPLFTKFGAPPEKAKEAAGGYYGNDYNFLLNQLGDYRQAEKAELCRCALCVSEGCMSLYASVVSDGNRIIWQDFENPRRFVDHPEVFKKFGPFIFDKVQYETAIGLGSGT